MTLLEMVRALGFVRVLDEVTLLIPDRRGNNRLDSLCNILVDPRVGLLFMIPGIDETLRVQGRARITTDPLEGERTYDAGIDAAMQEEGRG